MSRDSLLFARSYRPITAFLRDSTAAAALGKGKKRLSPYMFFPKGEPSVFPLASGTEPHDAARGQEPVYGG
jgi:hypothetical protein